MPKPVSKMTDRRVKKLNGTKLKKKPLFPKKGGSSGGKG